MQLVLIEPPTFPIITVAEAKLWLRIDHDDDDAQLAGLIAAATAMFDGRDGTLGRALAPQTWRMDLARFPSGVLIDMPLPPTIDIQSIEYTDTDGQTQELADYRLVAGGWGGAKVLPALGAVWPATARDTLDAVRITFTAGYLLEGSPPTLYVPEPIKQAMLLTISDWYDTRGNVTLNQHVAPLPFATEALIAPYRINLLV